MLSDAALVSVGLLIAVVFSPQPNNVTAVKRIKPKKTYFFIEIPPSKCTTG